MFGSEPVAEPLPSVIQRIELTNFMSHQRTVIEPAAGVTVLVGPNNCGKSAVVAALQILCRNENSTYVKRHGARDCSVIVETDDRQVVEWRRKTSPSYIINGQVFDRLKSGPLPEELHRVLKLPNVDTDGGPDFDIHFGVQKSPIFLLEKSGSQAARFFAASSDAIRLVAMQKRHKDKFAEAQREKYRLEAESRQLNSQLAILEPVVSLDDDLQALEETHLDLQRQDAELASLHSLIRRLTDAGQSQARWDAEARTLSELDPPPQLALVEPLVALIGSLGIETLRQRRSRAEVAACEELAHPPGLTDVRSLERLANNLTEQLSELTRLERSHSVLDELTPPPEFANVDQIARLLTDFSRNEAAVARAGPRSSVLETLSEPPQLEDVVRLGALVSELERRGREAAECERRMLLLAEVQPPPLLEDVEGLSRFCQRLTSEMEQVRVQQAERSKWTAEALEAEEQLKQAALDQHCPLCGGAIDPERLMQHTALHGGALHG